MTFKNITEKSVLNAAGRLVDPGKEILMPVEYYAAQKNFIDKYVTDKKAKITGESEYTAFIKGGVSEKKEEKKVDLMEEVIAEEKVVEPKKETPKKEEAKAEEPKTEEPVKEEVKTEEPKEEAPAPKKTTRRRKPAAKKEEA